MADRLQDPTAFPDRWRTCLNHVSDDNALGWIIGRFYAAKYFSPKALEMSQNIIKYVKQQYAKSIKSLDWLEAPVKAKALEKLEKLDALMGYGDKVGRRPSHGARTDAFLTVRGSSPSTSPTPSTSWTTTRG